MFFLSRQTQTLNPELLVDPVERILTQIISNGIFRSHVHRVMTNADRERLSVALFYSVDPDREIEPAAQLVDEKRPALYRKVKVRDYIAGFYGRFSEGAMVIDTVKI